MKIPRLLIPLLSGLFFPLTAFKEAPIQEKIPLSVTFSTTSHNRISVQDGSVEKILGPEAFFEIHIDRTTGNAFVTLHRSLPHPITLTVVTSTGLIQDLVISSSEGPSQHVILQEPSEPDELISISTDVHSPTIDLLNSILEGKVPLGYGQKEIQTTSSSSSPESLAEKLLEKELLHLPSPLVSSPLKAFESPFEEIWVYKIQNQGKDPILLHSQVLKRPPLSWVFLAAHELKSQQQTICILSYPKEER